MRGRLRHVALAMVAGAILAGTSACGAAVPSVVLPARAAVSPDGAAGIVPLPTGPVAGTPPGYQPVAATGSLELFVDPRDGQIAIWQRRSGSWWDSRATGFHGGSGWTQGLESAFILQVANASYSQLSPVDAAGSGRSVAIHALPGGAAVTYTIHRVGVAVTVDYVLHRGSLIWSLAPAGIVRLPHGARVAGIAPLPYFGAFPQGPGSLLIPDGSGALVSGADSGGPYASGYSARVYGSGSLPWKARGRPHANVAGFGIRRGPVALAATVTAGATLATVHALPAGDTAPLNRVRFSFRLRRPYRTFINQFTATLAYTRARTRRTLAVRYSFLQGAGTGGVAAAAVPAAWRHALQAGGGLPARRRGTRGALHVLLLMAVPRPAPGPVGSVPLTTFAQAIQILQALHAEGIRRVDATLLGWASGPQPLGGPGAWPPAAALGGTSGFQRLMRYAAAHGDRILPALDPLDAYAANGGFSPRAQVLTLPDHLPLERTSTGHFLLDGPASLGLVKAALGRLAPLASQGLALLRVGAGLPAQTQEGAGSLSRYWRAAATLAARAGGLQVEGGNAYLFPAGGTVLDAPIRDGGLAFESSGYPAWEVMVHGTLPYVAAPINLSANPRRALLAAEGVGALPSVELSGPPSKALESLQPDPYFAAGYRRWLSLARSAAAVSAQLAAVSRQGLVGYRRLAPNLTRTRFGPGPGPARVLWVNTGSGTAHWHGRTIPAEAAVWTRRGAP